MHHKNQSKTFHESPYNPPFNHDDLIPIATPRKYNFKNYSSLSHWWQGHEDKSAGEWRMFFKDKFPQRGSVGSWTHEQWYDIFTEFNLYQYPQFRSMLQDGKERFYWYMISFADLLNSDKDFVHALQNMRVADNKTLMQYIYEHAQNGKEYFAHKQQRKKLEQEHYKINEGKKDCAIALQDLLQDVGVVQQCTLDFLEKTVQKDFSPHAQERFAQRAHILENLILDNHSIKICNYQLTQDGKDVIQYLALDVSEWQNCCGNVMQQQFYLVI